VNLRLALASANMMCLQVPRVFFLKSGQVQYDSPRSQPRSATRYVLPDSALVISESDHKIFGVSALRVIFSSLARCWRSVSMRSMSWSSVRSSSGTLSSGGGTAKPRRVLSSRIMENTAPVCSQVVEQAEHFHFSRFRAPFDRRIPTVAPSNLTTSRRSSRLTLAGSISNLPP